jgi:hypothetical protein
MRVEQTAAVDAAKAGPRDRRVHVAEDMPADMFPLADPTALLAAELSVEGVEGLLLGHQFVGVAFDGLPRELRVHLDELHQASLGLAA